MKPESCVMIEDICQFIDRFGHDWDSEEMDKEFDQLALHLFKFQFQHNLPYKKYCQARRKSPLTVKGWKEIPPIPIQAFKELTLSCEPPENAEAVFMTSGTTNPEKKGRNYHPALTLWDRSMVPPFRRFVMPDREQITIFVLSPAVDLNQHSSLSRYLSMAVQHFGTTQSQFFFTEKGLDFNRLRSALRTAEQQGEPVLLIGASFAYVHILDSLKEQGLRFQLPAKSRIFDTGGFKGQSREITPQELYDGFAEYLGVERNFCINMYGMTELSSQIYDQTIRSFVLTGTPNHAKANPPWLKTLVLHPDTLAPQPNGELGVLAHYDLANWNSALAILTEDLGYQTEEGLILVGRVKGSEARGCSIAVDQLLQANQK